MQSRTYTDFQLINFPRRQQDHSSFGFNELRRAIRKEEGRRRLGLQMPVEHKTLQLYGTKEQMHM